MCIETLTNYYIHIYIAIMGAFDRVDSSDIAVSDEWHQNDGVVNTISMSGPKVGFSDSRDKAEIIPFSGGDILPGKFYSMPPLNDWDHISIVGLGLYNVFPFYKQIAQRLQTLSTSDTSLSNAAPAVPSSMDPQNVPPIYCNATDYYNFVCVNTDSTGATLMQGDDCSRLHSEMETPNWCHIPTSLSLLGRNSGLFKSAYLRRQ
jgi:hypothetical protein